jgi:prepilin-type N-terminal cleavage/methylation domain-containing protein
MYKTKKIAVRRDAFTLVEMLVVIAIILAVAALAAAFAPRVNDNQKLSRAVDNLEQWLLTAKMRAKRDGLATGLRFIQAPGDGALVPNPAYSPLTGPAYSQFQYIQQPEPLSGGLFVGVTAPGVTTPPSYPPGYPPPYQYLPNSGFWYSGGLLVSAAGGTVTFAGVDFWMGSTTLPPNPLVRLGDYLEINGGGVYKIQGATSPTTLLLRSSAYDTYGSSLTIAIPTQNYRILRRPRILIGEEPVSLPDNYAANFSSIPLSGSPLPGTNVVPGPSGSPEILFSPTGAVIGNNSATSTLVISVWDVPAMNQQPDPNSVGIVGIQCRTGFIGAYPVSLGIYGPFYFVQTARESGL